MEQTDTKALFTGKQLKALIWPLLLEQLLSVTMGFADTFMVSGVGESAVSSVSLVDNINILITQILSALSSGGAVVASQYLGRHDTENARKSSAQLYTVLISVTSVLMLAVLLFSRPILHFVFGSVERDVMDFSTTYFLISAVSYPFMGIYNAGAALFRAQGNSRISMLASLVMNVINIVGNAILIYGFKLGVTGAAIATLIGRIFAAVWVFVQNQNENNPMRVKSLSDMKPDKSHIARILKIGIPSGLENGMFQIGKICVSSLVSTLGTTAIAANAVANTVSSVANIPGNTMSLSTIPVIGRCIGAGEKKQARSYAFILMGCAMAGLFVSNSIMFFTIPYITGLFHLSKEASAMCVNVIRWFDLSSILTWAISFTLPNIIRSGGDAKFTMIVTIISMWCCRVLLSYFFVRELGMGLLGVWMGMFMDWVIRGILFVIRFFSGKWMEKKVI